MNLRIILVSTSHSGNIGSVARAMKTFALDDLYLVSPKAALDEKSTVLAANAVDILESAQIVDNLETAIKGCDRVVGTSTRIRRIDSICKPLRESMRSLQHHYNNIAIVFGAENFGLSNNELDLCDEQIYIPANPDYCSLNLAQAVQVVAYEWGFYHFEKPQKTNHRSSKVPDNKNNLASHDEFQGMLNHCEDLLLAINFLNPNEPRLLKRRLKHLFSRTQLDKKELNIIRGVFSAIQKKLS